MNPYVLRFLLSVVLGPFVLKGSPFYSDIVVGIVAGLACCFVAEVIEDYSKFWGEK